ncbi:MAG: hypothetical protein JWN69_2162 [Alphaproteobacteria bacterium]|nr:hypothetical protein [Alphaproteobacteria bacterium]
MTVAPPEFSRPVRIDILSDAPRSISVAADAAERAALAKRFDLQAVARLEAELSLVRTGETVSANGRLRAEVTQSCVATGAPVEAALDEPFRILFSPAPQAGDGSDEGIELSEEECDVVFYSGGAVDIGEAVAETLALSLDPWPRTLDAEDTLKQAGVISEEEAGPFAGLAGLRDKLKK